MGGVEVDEAAPGALEDWEVGEEGEAQENAEGQSESHAASTRRFLADREKGLRFGDEDGWLYGTNHVLRLSRLFDWIF